MASAEVVSPAERDWAWASPWRWILVAVAASGLAFLQARLLPEAAPAVRGALILIGLLAAAGAVCLHFQLGGLPFERWPPARRATAALALASVNALLALAATLLLLFAILGLGALPWGTGAVLFIWLVTAPWCAALAGYFLRRADGKQPVSEPALGAALLVLAALTAFLACWALYLGPQRAGEWDTIRLLLAVATLVALVASPIVAAPQRLRRLGVSVLIVFHFGAIFVAVTSSPPGPWLSQLLWIQVYNPYLEFMHLNNAYRFYSPEPFPSTQLWFRVEYREREEGSLPPLAASSAALLGSPGGPGPLLAAAAAYPGRDEVILSRWFKLPNVIDADGTPLYPLRLQYQRRLSLTENVGRFFPMRGSEFVDALGNKQRLPYVIKRDLHAPIPLLERRALGHEQPTSKMRIPYHPTTQRTQYAAPDYNSMLLLQSYARHAARKPHPDHPRAKAVSVKIYRAVHETLSADQLAAGADPQDLLTFLPYYQGQYTTDGYLMDREDPFLYWLLPTLPGDWSDPVAPRPLAGGQQGRSVFAFRHAGDEGHWIVPLEKK
jgi:hypothetical protein